MVWGRTSRASSWVIRSSAAFAVSSDRGIQAERGQALEALGPAYEGPRGIPGVKEGRVGSRGGAPIWVCREAWMPEDIARKRARGGGRWGPREGPDSPPYRRALAGGHDRGFSAGQDGADPDGFAVFGRYPKGFLRHIVTLGLLGPVRRDAILHVCSGTLSETERWTVDLRLEARPRVVGNGCALPFRDACVAAVMLDPPYSDQYARNLYGTENPRPSWLLREAARVVVPGGRIGLLHVAVPFSPPGCRLLRVYGVSTGVGFRIRAFTVFEREQASLL